MNTSILVFGAGKSATCLIEYLVQATAEEGWTMTVADSVLATAEAKTGKAPHTRAVALDVEDAAARRGLIDAAGLVISLLPPHLHIGVARDCVAAGKNLLTASYIDKDIRDLEPEIETKGLFFLCEMGLDPGIDHMSALQLIDSIHEKGGRLTAFRSHCGGLVAPESDDNPWHYKISWNPRNIVQAGKAGAHFLENGAEIHMPYESLFDASRVVDIPGLGLLAWYPNRDSLSYRTLYGLEETETFIRTTLRYPEFCFGWKNLIELKLTDETPQYDTDGMSLQAFFQQHLAQHGFAEWLEKQVTERFGRTKALLEKLQELLAAEKEISEQERNELKDFLMVSEDGSLKDINLETVKTQAAATVAGQMHEANLAMKQLVFLGMDDATTYINKGRCSALDVLQFCLEQKLALKPADKDMIVMLHELDYSFDNRDVSVKSFLVVKGEDNLRTAMAKTVGLPLGIAARLILKGQIKMQGLHIPVHRDIYTPVLEELKKHGVRFTEIVDSRQ